MAVAKRAMKKSTGENKGVLLVLSDTEAEVLRVLVARVGGDPANSPNKYVRRIRQALIDVGVGHDTEHYALRKDQPYSGVVLFKDYPKRETTAKPAVGPETLKGIAKVTEVSLKEERREPQVGDRVELLDYTENGKRGDIGTIVTVDRAFDYGLRNGEEFMIRAEVRGVVPKNRAYDKRFKIVSKNIAPTPAEPQPTITMGSRVKLREAIASFRAGEVAKVTRLSCGGGVHIESIGCGPKRTAGVTREDLIAA